MHERPVAHNEVSSSRGDQRGEEARHSNRVRDQLAVQQLQLRGERTPPAFEQL